MDTYNTTSLCNTEINIGIGSYTTPSKLHSTLHCKTKDASVVAIGVVFNQANHPLSFSKNMCHLLQATSVCMREMYAITKDIKNDINTCWEINLKILQIKKSLNTFLSQTNQTLKQ